VKQYRVKDRRYNNNSNKIKLHSLGVWHKCRWINWATGLLASF